MLNTSDSSERLFFSLKFSASQQKQLLPYQQLLSQQFPTAKPVAVDNLHLTLFFLGQVTTAQKLHLLTAAQSLTMPPFQLTLDTLAAFTKPKILYLAPSAVPAELRGLQQQLAKICKAQGFNEIHDCYRPHVTLLRHVSVNENFNRQIAPLPLVISEFALYQSVNIEGSVRYLPLHTFSG